MPCHFFPPEAEVPVALDKRIADSRIERGVRAGKEPDLWEQELDLAARRRAGIKDRASNEEDVRMPELFEWVPWFEELAVKVGEVRRQGDCSSTVVEGEQTSHEHFVGGDPPSAGVPGTECVL